MPDAFRNNLPAIAFLLTGMVVVLRKRPPLRTALRAVRSFLRLAARKTEACVAVGALVLLVRICLIPLWPKPEPRIYDEFSYVLMADTFAAGRATNPSPPHREHFESSFVQVTPPINRRIRRCRGCCLHAENWCSAICGGACGWRWAYWGWQSVGWRKVGCRQLGRYSRAYWLRCNSKLRVIG